MGFLNLLWGYLWGYNSPTISIYGFENYRINNREIIPEKK
jgi:hypothetical protein